MIAATSVISAINALTLKPAQCALWLRPGRRRNQIGSTGVSIEVLTPQRPPTWWLSVGWSCDPGPCSRSFSPSSPLLRGSSYVAHRLLPTEDQGYAILFARLPDGARPAARARSIGKKIGGVLNNTPGIESWVTIGGYSFLDGANIATISSTFIIYEDWKKRGAALNQDKAHSPPERTSHRYRKPTCCDNPPSHPWSRSSRRIPDGGRRQTEPRSGRAPKGGERSGPTRAGECEA